MDGIAGNFHPQGGPNGIAKRVAIRKTPTTFVSAGHKLYGELSLPAQGNRKPWWSASMDRARSPRRFTTVCKCCCPSRASPLSFTTSKAEGDFTGPFLSTASDRDLAKLREVFNFDISMCYGPKPVEEKNGEQTLLGHSPGYHQLLGDWMKTRQLTGKYGEALLMPDQ